MIPKFKVGDKVLTNSPHFLIEYQNKAATIINVIVKGNNKHRYDIKFDIDGRHSFGFDRELKALPTPMDIFQDMIK